ncbi:GatB/YqeY domain-containing protein [Paenibacillus illinoisensis]|uniref:GatB/YqeY domain-containing protein n=1 Tax=Paenibacillus illinoisensis TaxID=59845 RepID=UPI003016E129
MIKEQLTIDMKEAMKNDKAALPTIRMIKAAIQRKEQDMKDEAIRKGADIELLSDEGVMAVIQTFKKQTEEEIAAFEKAGNAERVAELNESLKRIVKYLPAQMSKEDVVSAVWGIFDEMVKQAGFSAPEIGKGDMMKEAMQQLKGKAENRMISEAVNELFKR